MFFELNWPDSCWITFMGALIRMAAIDHAEQGEETICNPFADGLTRDTGIRFRQILYVYFGHSLPHLH